MKDLLDFEITRDKIPLYTVDAGFMIDGTTGYVRVNRFAATTYDELTEALTRLQGSGMKRLILDLRDNAGGYLEQAFKMADELMPKGKKIVYTKGRRPEFDDEYVSQGQQFFGVRERNRGWRRPGLGSGHHRRRIHVRQGAGPAPV
jgi:carboxyl-terminal processing protease